ncbi:MAG: hypothetical protein FJZ63_07610 [Chlamydiae bacterium]|nr:hypothetical protein [Chlamydiota bacterium]
MIRTRHISKTIEEEAGKPSLRPSRQEIWGLAAGLAIKPPHHLPSIKRPFDEQLPEVPVTPKKETFLKEPDTPSKTAASALKKTLILDDSSQEEPVKSKKFATTARVFGIASLKGSQKRQETLKGFLEGFKETFFGFAKRNSSNRELTRHRFSIAFEKLLNVFLGVENREFLDAYLVRDCKIGINKHKEVQEKFKAFHEKLEELKQALENIEITGYQKGQSINFWSGIAGQRRASEDEESLSDSDIPLFKFLFECWGALREAEKTQKESFSDVTSLLPLLFSSMFATYAKGSVNVYMASKRDHQEQKTVICADSAFWSVELASLLESKSVTQVNLFLHLGQDEQGEHLWEEPIDLKSQDPDMRARKKDIVLSKRGATDLAVSMRRIEDYAQRWFQKSSNAS